MNTEGEYTRFRHGEKVDERMGDPIATHADLMQLIRSELVYEPRRAGEYTIREMAEVARVSDNAMISQMDRRMKTGEVLRRKARIERTVDGRVKNVVTFVYWVAG